MKLRGFFILPPLLAIALSGEEPAAPKYKFEPGQTNAYRITIESTGEANRPAFEGVIFAITDRAEESGATVSFRGRLMPRRDQPPTRVLPGPAYGPSGMMGSFGPHNPFGDLYRGVPLTAAGEAQVDSRGRILRVAGLPELSKPLENYAALIFHELPPEGVAHWQREMVLAVDDSASPSGYPPRFYPGGGGAARLNGTRVETVELTEDTEDTLELRTTSRFESWLESGGEPRLAYSSTTKVVFDRAAGTVRSATIEGTSITSSPDILQRFPVIARVELLDREEAIESIPAEIPGFPAAISDSEFNDLLEQLKGEDPTKRLQAAQKLLGANLDERAEALLPVLRGLLGEEDHGIRLLATRVLARTATLEDVPQLIRILQLGDIGGSQEIVQTLRRLRDKRSIEPLADLILRGGPSAHIAAEALADFGPEAEDAALMLLEQKHIETRRHALTILRRAGTERSIEAIQANIASPDEQLSHAAAAAIRSIRMRTGLMD